MLADFSAALLDDAGLAPGERMVESGCGSGQSARRFATAVAPGGTLVGADTCPALVRLATQAAVEAGTGNFEILGADAQTTVPPGAPFDRLV